MIDYAFSVLPACMSADQKMEPDLITDDCELLLGTELRTFGRAVFLTAMPSLAPMSVFLK